MSHELSVPSRRGVLATREQRAVARRVDARHGTAIERRAEDALRRELASGRMKDITSLTKDALDAGGEIADVLAGEVQARPFFARELADIASTGARGLKSELRGYRRRGLTVLAFAIFGLDWLHVVVYGEGVLIVALLLAVRTDLPPGYGSGVGARA